MKFSIEARTGYPLIITGLNYTDDPKRIEVFKDIDDGSPPWPRVPFIGGGSVIMDHSDDQGVYDFILECLSDCITTHEHCDARNPVSLPSRLLEVSDQNHTCRLVEPAKDQLGTYMTLSYCWGNGNPLKLTRGLYNSFQNGISWIDLPQLFRDAIRITNRLGVSYLWIDSLCIVQDDRKDWEIESEKMASIYQNAHITIVAASAPDPEAPILGARGQQMEKAEFEFTEEDGSKSYLFSRCISDEPFWGLRGLSVIRVKNLQSRDWSQTIYNRGWTFQEDLLSRRTIHYLPNRVVWECWMSHCDERQLPRDPNHRKKRYKMPKPSQESWPELVTAYTVRNLTHTSDTLPAMSGIAYMVSEGTCDEYLAGLWRSSFVVHLACPCKEYIAPTWSWASTAMKDTVEMHGKSEDARTLTVLIDAKVDVKGGNKFGEVSGGFIQLRGPVCEMQLYYDDGWYRVQPRPLKEGEVNETYQTRIFPDTRLCAGDGLLETGEVVPTICRKYADLQTEDFGLGDNAYHAIYMIALWRTRTHVAGIVIGRSPRVPGAYERLGMVNSRLKIEKGGRYFGEEASEINTATELKRIVAHALGRPEKKRQLQTAERFFRANFH
ncbi:hypothetical protein G4B11_000955 [Aspergillus flavus]|nr:hypothetical protein G4B11_000955 [Aspergillus flavus]